MMIMSRSGALVHERRIARWLARITSKAPVAFGTLLLLLGSGVLLPAPSAQAASAAGGEPVRYFPTTGHNLGGPLKAFYDRHGGEAVFGLSINEAMSSGDSQLQYFERARFELRQRTIVLSLIGRAVSEGRNDPAFAWLTDSPTPDRTFYPQSGHTLGGAFGAFWQGRGGLPIFGYPIAEEFVENGVLVQYFERTRFEYRPEQTGAAVQISLLGHAYAQRMGVREELLAPAPPIVELGAATIAIPAAAQHNVALAAQQIDGAAVPSRVVLSFLQTIGEVSRRTGYESGQAIVNGELRARIGGGICYVSTALYRAAFLAGLPIVERHPHSIALASLSDVPGFDAAVDTSSSDLRWRNDTPTPILVTAELNNGWLTVALWGQGDGRKTTMRAPSVKKGADTQTTTISRIVMAANGTLIRKETVESRYAVVNIEARARRAATN